MSLFRKLWTCESGSWNQKPCPAQWCAAKLGRWGWSWSIESGGDGCRKNYKRRRLGLRCKFSPWSWGACNQHVSGRVWAACSIPVGTRGGWRETSRSRGTTSLATEGRGKLRWGEGERYSSTMRELRSRTSMRWVREERSKTTRRRVREERSTRRSGWKESIVIVIMLYRRLLWIVVVFNSINLDNFSS